MRGYKNTNSLKANENKLAKDRSDIKGAGGNDKMYTGFDTRFFSLDSFMGDGKTKQTYDRLDQPICLMPVLAPREQFNSGLNKKMQPSSRGYDFGKRPIMGTKPIVDGIDE